MALLQIPDKAGPIRAEKGGFGPTHRLVDILSQAHLFSSLPFTRLGTGRLGRNLTEIQTPVKFKA
jgi:hypothetical protein